MGDNRVEGGGGGIKRLLLGDVWGRGHDTQKETTKAQKTSRWEDSVTREVQGEKCGSEPKCNGKERC